MNEKKWKQALSIIVKNPKTVLIFMGIALVPLLLLIPYFISYINIFVNISVMDTAENITSGIFGNFIVMLISFVFSMLISIGITVFVYPPLLTYIYELGSNQETAGWYKRGLKKNWWRTLAFGAIVSFAYMPIMLVVLVFNFIPFIGFIVSIAVVLAYIVFIQIGVIAVVAEENFGTALKNTFVLGWKYSYKLAAAIAITYAPYYITVIILSISYYIQLFKFGSNIEELMNSISNYAIAFFVMLGVLVIYLAIVNCYLLVYNSILYFEAKKSATPILIDNT